MRRKLKPNLKFQEEKGRAGDGVKRGKEIKVLT